MAGIVKRQHRAQATLAKTANVDEFLLVFRSPAQRMQERKRQERLRAMTLRSMPR